MVIFAFKDSFLKEELILEHLIQARRTGTFLIWLGRVTQTHFYSIVYARYFTVRGTLIKGKCLCLEGFEGSRCHISGLTQVGFQKTRNKSSNSYNTILFQKLLEIIKSSTVMMGSLVSIAKVNQFVTAIVRSEDFNIVVLILVMVHALVNVLNGNLVWSAIRVYLQSQSKITRDHLAKLVY